MKSNLPQAVSVTDHRDIADRLNGYYPHLPIKDVALMVMHELGGKANPHKVIDYLEELREDAKD